MKTNLLKPALCLGLLVSISSLVYSQKVTLNEGMKAGFDLFTDGEEFADWLKAAEDLSSLGKEHPNEWLPEYWSSYFYTQIARGFPENPPKGVTKAGLLKKSQENFDRAFKKVQRPSPETQSEFYMLQALIYAFNGLEAEEDIEIKKAIKANPNNPLIDVYLATDLIRTKDYKSLYSARVLLVRAKNKYASRMKPRYLSAHWNEEWVGYWLPQAEKGLTQLTAL